MKSLLSKAPANEVAQTTNAQIDSLIESVKSEDPAKRLQAVLALAGNRRADQETVDTVLNAALTDEDRCGRKPSKPS